MRRRTSLSKLKTPDRRRRLWMRERAQSLVEFSLVLPVLLILGFGVIDFGMGLHSWMTVTNATREGARIAAVHAASSGSIDCNPLPSAGTIERKICDTGANLDADDMTITVTNADPGGTQSGQPVTVQVSYEYDLITPFAALVQIPSLTMTSTVIMRLE